MPFAWCNHIFRGLAQFRWWHCHFSRSPRYQKFCMRAKDFPLQITSSSWPHQLNGNLHTVIFFFIFFYCANIKSTLISLREWANSVSVHVILCYRHNEIKQCEESVVYWFLCVLHPWSRWGKLLSFSKIGRGRQSTHHLTFLKRPFR